MTPRSAKERARQVAAGQAGRITFAQLLAGGLTADDVQLWIAHGTLARTRPRVYALGYDRDDTPARLWEAVLYAGPGARLAGACAAHHCGLLRAPPALISVASPRRCRSLPGIRVLERRSPQRASGPDGLPVSRVPELLLELAADPAADLTMLRFVLANLEFRRQLDLAAILSACGHGRRGSRLLRRALARRLPQLAHTRSPLEVDFLLLLEAHHLPLPAKVNVWVHGVLVDMYWPQIGLVVELDGAANHGTAAQRRRDAERDATLRARGLTVLRLGADDVYHDVAATLTRLAMAGLV